MLFTHKIHVLFVNALCPFPHFSTDSSTPPETSAGKNRMAKVPSGRVTVGKPRDFPSYGWDNEYGQAEIE